MFYSTLLYSILFYSVISDGWSNQISSYLISSYLLVSYHTLLMLRRAFLSYDSHIIFAYTTSLQSNIFLVYALPTPSLPPSLSPSLLFLSCYHSPSFSISSTLSIYLQLSPSPLFYNSPTCLLHCLSHSSYLSLPVLFLPYLFIFSLYFSIFVTTSLHP